MTPFKPENLHRALYYALQQALKLCFCKYRLSCDYKLNRCTLDKIIKNGGNIDPAEDYLNTIIIVLCEKQQNANLLNREQDRILSKKIGNCLENITRIWAGYPPEELQMNFVV